MRIFLSLLCIAIFGGSAFGQASKTFSVDKDEPWVYIEFDHLGEWTRAPDTSFERRIFLRLVNNCPEPLSVLTAKSDGVAGVLLPFSVERVPLNPLASEPPAGLQIAAGENQRIAPGQSLLFTVPATSVSKDWYIVVPFTVVLPTAGGAIQPRTAAEFHWRDFPIQAQHGEPIQAPTCDEVVAMAQMSRANSAEELLEARSKAGGSYGEQIVYAARLFELHPKSEAAALRLLNLMPQYDEDPQVVVWEPFGVFCNAASRADEESLADLGERLPHDLAKAVLLVPEKMPAYVAYGAIAIGDPHSDFVLRMKAVCRAKHPEFVKAVTELPAHDKDFFVKQVMNPESCQPLTFPEAD